MKNGDTDGPAAKGDPECGPGHTGFVSGDFNGDGDFTDSNTYWALTNPVSATIMAPARPEDVKLMATPPSALIPQLPIAAAIDSSYSVMYDLQEDSSVGPYQYDMSRYIHERFYPVDVTDPTPPESQKQAWLRMDAELVPGVYRYSLPDYPTEKAGYPGQVRVLPISLLRFVEPYQATPVAKNGLRFLGTMVDVNPDPAVVEMRHEVNSRIANTTKWSPPAGGTLVASDSLRINVRQDLYDTMDPSVDTDSSFLYRFPILGYTRSVFQVSPRVTSHTFPALPYLLAGDEVTFTLNYKRNITTGNATYDASERFFEYPMVVRDTFADYQQATFPVNTAKAVMAANADYDGDKWSNVLEYALEFGTQEAAFFSHRQLNPPDAGIVYRGLDEPIVRRAADATLVPLNASHVPFGDAEIFKMYPGTAKETWYPVSHVDGSSIVLELPTRPLVGTSLRHDFKIETAPGSGRFKPLRVDGVRWKLDVLNQSDVFVTGECKVGDSVESFDDAVLPNDNGVPVPVQHIRLSSTAAYTGSTAVRVIYTPTYVPLK